MAVDVSRGAGGSRLDRSVDFQVVLCHFDGFVSHVLVMPSRYGPL